MFLWTALRRLGAVEGRIEDGILLPSGEKLTLNELNNIILSHPNILDFSSEYFPDKMQLSIGLDLIPETDPDLDIRPQLLDYPKIKKAVEDHKLIISIIPVNHCGAIHSGFGKRTITTK